MFTKVRNLTNRRNCFYVCKPCILAKKIKARIICMVRALILRFIPVVLFFYCCLRHNNTFLNFNYLQTWCKPRVSEYLFNIVLTVGFRTQ